MDVHASEKEQVEALRKWWTENGSSVITGILLGLSALIGTKAWFGYQENQALSASNSYAEMMVASGAGEKDKVQALANELISKHSGSGYAPLAALLLARDAVENGELGAAQAQLRWAMDHAESGEVKHIARTRLVRVLIDEKQYSEAQTLIESVHQPGAYAHLYDELKGDLALAQGDPAKAAGAYRQALQQMPPQAPGRALLTAKYENTGAGGEVD